MLRINNKKIPKNTARREEYKDNNDYNYNEEQLTDNNVYFKTGIENNKRKVVLKKEKQYTDDTDEVARKKRLERQKRKLKEELWGIGGGKSFRSKINRSLIWISITTNTKLKRNKVSFSGGKNDYRNKRKGQ